jgi:hypothetical protein
MKVENTGAHVATGSEMHMYSDTNSAQFKVVLACLWTLDANIKLNGTSYKNPFSATTPKVFASSI